MTHPSLLAAVRDAPHREDCPSLAGWKVRSACVCDRDARIAAGLEATITVVLHNAFTVPSLDGDTRLDRAAAAFARAAALPTEPGA